MPRECRCSGFGNMPCGPCHLALLLGCRHSSPQGFRARCIKMGMAQELVDRGPECVCKLCCLPYETKRAFVRTSTIRSANLLARLVGPHVQSYRLRTNNLLPAALLLRGGP